MEPESAEVASRARDAARDAATAPSRRRRSMRRWRSSARRCARAETNSGARADVKKKKKEKRASACRARPGRRETRARRTREAARGGEARARDGARARCGRRCCGSGGVRGVRSAAALDAERRASSWRTHEARWCAFCRDEDASALAAPFPSSGRTCFWRCGAAVRNSDLDARRSENSSKSSSKSLLRASKRFCSLRVSMYIALRRTPDPLPRAWRSNEPSAPPRCGGTPTADAQTFAGSACRGARPPRAALERRVAETFRDVREAYERMERNVSTNDDD